MHEIILIICVVALIASVAILALAVRANRRTIREQRAQVEQQHAEVEHLREQLSDYMTGMAALTASMENAKTGSGTEVPNQRRERWLKAVPPLGVVMAAAGTAAGVARAHTGRIVAGASATASAATVGLIAVSTTPVTAPNTSALPPTHATTTVHRSVRPTPRVPPETTVTATPPTSTLTVAASGPESLAGIILDSSQLSFPSSALVETRTTVQVTSPPASTTHHPTGRPTTPKPSKPSRPPECFLTLIVGGIDVQACSQGRRKGASRG